MTDEQLADWWLLYQCSPFGDEREDYRAWFASLRAWDAEGHVPTWPYMEQPISSDELKALVELRKQT